MEKGAGRYVEPVDDSIRTGCSVAAIKRDLIDNLFYIQARFPDVANDNDAGPITRRRRREF
mgnify:CR=1 FL=1